MAKLKIPLGFDETLASLLKVKPPAKGKAASTEKRPTKKRVVKKRTVHQIGPRVRGVWTTWQAEEPG
jgi:hypothetical protein